MDSAGAGTSVDPVVRLGGLARLLPSPFSINFEERSSFEGDRDGGGGPVRKETVKSIARRREVSYKRNGRWRMNLTSCCKSIQIDLGKR